MASMSSFVGSAQDPHQDFTIHNLPLGIGETWAGDGKRTVYSRIGDTVVNLDALASGGFLSGPILSSDVGRSALRSNSLNEFADLGPNAWFELRQTLQRLLSSEEGVLRDDKAAREKVFYGLDDVVMRCPMEVGDYTDFYSSKEHASNVGAMFGRDPPLMHNWGCLPVGYHGRASSVVVSGTPVRRPRGLVLPKGATDPVYKECGVLDYELEMGFFVGQGNDLGCPIPCDDARKHILGLVLVNDWSARDIQKFEYVPLGPFTAKNFATTVSPWIVTLDALEPFEMEAPEQTLAPVSSYLCHSAGRPRQTYDIDLEVSISTSQNPETKTVATRSNFKHLYWTIDQMLAHHTVTGCNARTGDLIATGTITGSREDPMSYGSLLEKSWGGTRNFKLDCGAERTYLLDGDRVTMRGRCERGGVRVGFGECTGVVLPANPEASN